MNRKYPTLEARLLAHCVTDPDTDCWIWTAYCDSKNGYPRITLYMDGGPRGLWAHRVAYETLLGIKIARGMTLEHTCRVSSCINPAHLIEVTRAENTRLMQAYRACLRRGSMTLKPGKNVDTYLRADLE